MSLSSIVSSKIDQELKDQVQTYQKEETLVAKQLKQRVSDIQRIYTQEVEQAVKSRVNLVAFLAKKDHSFEAGVELNNQLDALYQDLLPEMLETSYGKAQLQAFLAGATKDTAFEVKGMHTELLSSILRTALPQASVATTSGTALGSITYTVDQTTWEFSLEDFLDTVQSKTLSDVLALI